MERLSLFCFTQIVLCLFCFTQPAAALEKDYQTQWCNAHHGKMEVVLEDEARVDCVTKEYAVEMEFAHKWAESIGQSLYYAMSLKKKPAVALIADKDRDYRYIGRLRMVARKYGIKVFLVEE